MTIDDQPEIPLFGGDVSDGVVRKGDTVRRHPAEGSAAVHAYLVHLEKAGFAYSPRFLGFDDQGREILTFVDGEMGGRPLNPWAVTEDALVAIAGIQRELHDLSETFDLPEGVRWRERPNLPGLPPLSPPDIVGHNDITFENTIFRDGRPVGIIDFDLAGPTTRLRDVVTTLVYWAPHIAPVDRDPALRDVDAARRTRLFADAYGLDDADRHRIIDEALLRASRSWVTMKHMADTRGGGWRRMWDEGVGDVIRRREAWLHAERDRLEEALR